MRVLVTGGTGVVGRPTVDRLLERGHTVRLLSRHADEDAQDWPEGVEAFQAHVADAGSLHGAADGCDVVLHLAGIAVENPPEATFERVNVEGTRNLLMEATRAGAPRFVYVSSLGAERGESDYHRSKHTAEQLVRGYAGDWLIVRPGNVYGPGDEVVSLLLKMVRTLPVVPVIGNGDQPFQPIWAEDCATALALAVESTRRGEALDLAGEETITPSELLDRFEEITDRHPRRVPLPERLAMVGAELAETVGVDVRLHSDQLVMLAEGNVIPPGGTNALRDVFGVEPTSLSDGLALLADALPERMPDEGTGPLRRHRYWADIEGSELDAADIIDLVRREFRTLTDPVLIRVGVEPGSGDELQEGETVTLAIPMRGNIQVRVEEVAEHEITAVTLEGHPLSGTVRFLSEELPGDVVRFEVRTYTRPSTLVDRMAMAMMGETIKGAAWKTLVEAVVERSGGEVVGKIETRVEELTESAAEDVEEWVEDVVRKRKAKAAS